MDCGQHHISSNHHANSSGLLEVTYIIDKYVYFGMSGDHQSNVNS